MCVKMQLRHICYVQKCVYTCDKPVGCSWTQLETSFHQIRNEPLLLYVAPSQADTSKAHEHVWFVSD